MWGCPPNGGIKNEKTIIRPFDGHYKHIVT